MSAHKLLGWLLSWTLLLGVGGPPPARAESPAAGASYSFSDALRQLRAHHPSLKAAGLALRAAQADKTSAKLWSNPSLSGAYNAGVRHSSYDAAGYSSYGLSQALELSNAPGARKRVAELLVLASRADYDALELELTLALEAALIDVAAAKQRLELVGRALELLEQAARIVTQRVAAGASPRYDGARIGLTVASAHADRESSRAELARAEAELRAAIGPGVAFLHGQPAYGLEAEPALPAPVALVDVLVRHHPALQAARQRAASARANILAVRRSVWPGVALSVLAGYGAAPSQLDLGVGLSTSLPVIDRGQGIIPAAEARALEAAAYADALLMPARERVAGKHAEVVGRRRALAEYRALALGSGDQMLAEAQAGYVAGRFSVLELADAYAAWRDARLRAIELAAAARNAELELGRVVGRSLREL